MESCDICAGRGFVDPAFEEYKSLAMKMMGDLQGRFNLLTADRDALARQNAALRAKLERLHKAAMDLRCVTALPLEMRAMDHARAIQAVMDALIEAESALALTPPAALDALRRREREAALLEAADRIGPEYGEHQAAWALRKMADAIAAERKEGE